MRRLPHALAALAAIILAVAGCLAASVPARAASDLSLVILPDQGENAIYTFVNSAASSINVTISELKDTTLQDDLACRRVPPAGSCRGVPVGGDDQIERWRRAISGSICWWARGSFSPRSSPRDWPTGRGCRRCWSSSAWGWR
ncbi:MAG TPA: hypothetical protein VGG75_23820 [Trebonia sp.]|jgi:hypothetical protein